MTDVLSIVVTVTGYLFPHIKSQMDYVFNCSENVDDLNRKVEKLIDAREGVQHSVDDARRKGEEIERYVGNWLRSVDKIIEEATKIVKDEDEANKGCFIGLCPNLKMRYQLSKQATEKAKAVVELQGEGKFDKVSYRSIPQGIRPASIKGYETFESRMSTLKDILEALADPNISILGVYGMPGVGKTTLVKEVARRAKEDKLFDKVVFAVVRQTPDIEKIQGEIAYELGLEFHKIEFGKASRLCDRLKKEEKILVILDDVWARLDLEAVGIPFGDDHKGCKILLTSRSKDVLSCKMDTQNNFSVGVLTEEESWNLFKKMAGDFVESPDLQSTAIEVAKECAGLPIAIVTVAKALRNRSLVEWKDALRQLRRPSSTNFTGMKTDVYSTIELSYNHLEGEEVKSTFLLCGLMGYHSNLDLLKYATGLGLFQGINTIEEARDRVYALVGKLKASCLLIDSYTDEWFAMHDVVCDVSRYIASRDEHVLAVRNEVGQTKWLNKDTLKNCTAISLFQNDIAELPEELECPQVKFFYMYSKDPSLKIPDNFFKWMTELRVLDLTKMHFLSLPSSLRLLANVQTLCLHHCVLGEIAIIGELKKLEILSFYNSDIEQLPAKMAQLTRLKLLDLTYCFRLKVIPQNVIRSLSQLEELHMGNSFIQWEVEGNASLTELKHLSHLTTLHIHIPDANILPKDLFSKKLERYRIVIGDEWGGSRKYDISRTLKLKLNTSIHQEDGIIMQLKRAEDLYLGELKGVKHVLYELDTEGFPQLKHLHVQNGPNFECIINSMKWVPRDAFPVLESFSLHNLINLRKICDGQLTAASFSKLRIIKVGNCNSLKNLFTFSKASGLSQLQTIEVINCMIMEDIIAVGRDDDVNCNEVFDKMEFTQLRSLTLQSLPKLTSFLSERKSPPVSQERQNLLTTNSGSKEIVSEEEHDIHITMPLINEKVVFPNLEELKLSAINVENIWHNQFPPMSSCIQNLTRLIVEGCSRLKYLFSSSMVKSFVQLKHLEISECSILEEIIVTEGTGEEEVKDKMLFPQLNFLRIKLLQNLTKFSSGNYMEFPSLKELYIDHCPKMKAFIFKSSTDNTAGKEVEEMNSVESHHAGIHPFFNEMIAFPSLEGMLISHVDNLKMLWHNQLSPDSFGKLKSLKVEYCEKLLTIFPSNTLGRFWRLHLLTITDCGSLEGVFELQGMNIEESHPVADIQLRALYIHRLPKLKHAWNKDPEGIFSFENLHLVSAFECQSLRNLFPASVARGLSQLEELNVNTCGVEQIVAKEEGIKASNRFVFPRLTSLTLWKLPELNSFYPGMHTSEWPLLKKLIVYHCDKVKTFASESLSFQETHWEGQVDIPKQQPLFYVEKVVFPNLEELKLSAINVENIWHNQFPPMSSCIQNLTRLIVEGCSRLKYLFSSSMVKSFVQLKHLEISECSILEEIIVTEGTGEEEVKDKMLFPQLNFLRIKLLQNLTKFSSGNYMEFPSLKELYIDHCPKMKAFIFKSSTDNTAGKEVEEMNSVESHHAGIHPFFNEMIAFPSLEGMLISHVDNLKMLWHNQLSPDSFGKLKSLKVEYCEKLLTIFPSNTLGRFWRLHLLTITDCGSLEGVFELQGMNIEESHPVADIQLRALYIHRLPKLKHAWNKDPEGIFSFENLHLVSAFECQSLRNLFPASVARGLSQLEELNVNTCGVEQIVAKEEGIKASNRFVFPRLTSLTLWKLPELNSFYPGMHTSEWPLLKKLIVYHCDKVKTFASESLSFQETHWEGQVDIPKQQPLFYVEKVVFPNLEELKLSAINVENIWHNQFPPMSSCIQNLTRLIVEGCSRLKYLFSSSMVKSFVQLKHLEISECSILEEIIVTEGTGEEEVKDKMLFPQLNFLRIKLLQNLTKFSSGNYMEFPSLKELYIDHCPKMKAFIFKSSTDNTAGKEVEEMNSVESHHAGIHPFFNEMIAFPSLEGMLISHVDNLKMLWHNQLSPDSFGKLKSLKVEYCEKLLTIFPSNTLGRFWRLHLLTITDCGSLEGVFELQGMNIEESHPVADIQLRALYIHRLPKLKHAWNKDPEGIFSFENLHLVSAFECQSLRNLFPASVARGLSQLEELNVNTCGVEQIVAKEEGIKASNRFVFPRLTSLTLWKLPELNSFYPGMHTSEWPLLKKLIVYHCDKVKTFASESLSFQETHWEGQVDIPKQQPLFYVEKVVFPNLEELKLSAINVENIWHNQFPPMSSCIQNLTRLIVEGCSRLKYLFSSSMVKSFVQLKHLEISECSILEEIIVTEGTGEEEVKDKMLFPQLNFLRIKLLQNLTKFSSGNYMEFPSLKELYIDHCPKMKAFIFKSSTDNTAGKEVEEMNSVESHHAGIHPFFNEMIAFPSLEGMLISHVDNLKMLWHNQLSPDSFGKLKSLKVEYCEKLLTIFPSNTLGRFWRLHLLTITDCGSLEGVFELQGMNIEESHPVADIQLRALYIHRLPKLKHAWNKDPEGIFSFENLHLVSAFECQSLRNLFPASVARGLSQLEELNVNTCGVEQIVAKEEGIKASNRFVFPRLTSLTLWKLPELNSFYPGMHTSEWPLLKKLIVYHCDKVKTFASESLSFQETHWEGQVDIPKQQPLFYVEKVVFPNLEELKLSAINVENIWHNQFPPMSSCIQNLTRLIVEGCSRLKYLFSSSMVKSFVQLKHLEISECSILEEIIVTEGTGEEEVKDKMLFPQLNFLRIKLLQNLTKFSSGNYMEFPSLKELYIDHCPKMKAFIFKSSTDNTAGKEVEEMNSVESHHAGIHPFFNEMIAFPSLEGMLISHVDNLKMLWHNQLSPDSFGKLKSLKVEYCEKLLTIFPSNTLGRFWRLHLLTITDCGSLEGVFELQGMNIEESHPVADIQLRALYIHRLPKLKHAWNKDPEGIFSFENLHLVSAFECQSLRNLFPASVARGLSQLEELNVNTCGVEQIVAKEEGIKASNRFVFPRLTSLTLWKLPELNSFYPGMHTSEWPLLKKLIVYHCDKVKTFASESLSFQETHWEGQVDIPKQQPLFYVEKVVFPNLEELKLSAINVENIWHNQFPPMSSCIQNLTRLIVEGCSRLKYLFSSSMVKSFVQLKHLEISECSILEEIIVTEGTGEEEVKDKMLFPQLNFLRIKLLQNLTTFSSGNYMEFPSLKELYIDHCPKMKAFIFKSSTDNTAGKEVEEMNSVESHHAGIHPFFNEMIAFPSLEGMLISHVDNLKMLWHNQLSPDSFGKLKSLKVEYCEKLLTIFPSNTLGRFWRLHLLTITDCGSLEGVFELQGMNIEESHPVADIQLRALYIHRLPKLKHAWNKDPEGIFSFENLHLVSAFECQSLRNLFPASVARGLLQLEELKVDTCGVEQIVAKEEGIKATNRFVFPRLTSLNLWNLPELNSFYPGMHTSEWPLLKKLIVYHCDKVKTFASESLSFQETHWEGQVDIPMQQPLFYVEKVIPNLEELSLNSKDIEMIRYGQFPVDLFHKLKVLHVTCFHDESAIFPFGFLQRFHNLENLDVLCSRFEELFPYEGLVGEENLAKTLAQIRHLKLRLLPYLKHIWKQDYPLKSILQNLETLEVRHCHSLTNLAPLSASFQNLMTLDVSNCIGLKYLLTSSTVKSLVQLIKMSIKECVMVTEVVASDQGDEAKDEIIFNKLKCLGLHCLPSLTSFCSANQTFKFPILEEVIVRQCPKMMNFSQGVLSTPKLQRLQLTEGKDKGRWEGDLNTTIQQLHTETVTEAWIDCVGYGIFD